MLNSVATLTLSVATGIRGNAQNKMYPQTVKITNLQELFDAAQFDHVAGTFTNAERGNDNFINADCIIMDCDNDGEKQGDYFSPQALAERLPHVPFFTVYSRNHMKDKGTVSARPRFHVYFQLSKAYTQAADIAAIKEALLRLVPEFDAGAKDAARFIFGVADPHGEAFTGTVPVDDYVEAHVNDMFTANTSTSKQGKGKGKQAKSGKPARGEILSETPSLLEQMITAQHDCKGYFDFIANPEQVIPEGNRHTVLLQIAVGALANEDIDSAKQTYEKACRQCTPPHDKQDCARIWNDAKAYVKSKEDEQQAFDTSGKKKHKPLSLPAIEASLESKAITVRHNVITKKMEVSGLPEKGYTVPKKFATLSAFDRDRIAPELLPLCLTPALRKAGYTFTATELKNNLNAWAKLNSYNPVKAMIDRTTWDGKDRISKLYAVLGLHLIEDKQAANFYAMCVRKFLHQAIALGLNDEGKYCQSFVLTLQGAQGIGKTLFFRRLAVYPEFFLDGAVIDMSNKDSKIESVSTWICELGELDSTMKKEQSSLKGHLVRQQDKIRMPYGEAWTDCYRHTCYCATVNPEQVHRDDTGSRRFVYLHVEHMDKDFILNDMTPEWCAQLWRQVYDQLYMPNPAGYFLTDKEQAYSEKSNEEFRVPLKAETELRDLIDFEECYKIDPADGTPCKVFIWYTASEVKRLLKLKMYSANQIGEALKYLCTVYPHCKRKRVKGKTTYLLPPIPEPNDD